MATDNYTSTPRGSKAPSEKHLEDWIVANPEKCVVPANGRLYPLVGRILARQPRFPAGTPDLIVERAGAVTVVELERGVVDFRAVAQVMRYQDDLRKISDHAIYRAYRHYGYEPYPWEPTEIIPSGFIVGSHVECEEVLKICHYSDIHVFTYDYRDEAYTFQHVFLDLPPRGSVPLGSSAWNEWAYGVIGDHFIAQLGIDVKGDA